MTRNRFLLLSAGVLVVAFAVGLAVGMSSGSSGGTASSRPSPTPTVTASASAAAIADLPASLYTGCKAQHVAVGTGLTCATTLAGVDEVLVVKWPDAAAMQADWAKTQGSRPDGKCGSYTGKPAAGLSSTWGNGQPLACYVNSNGAAVVLWEVPDRALELLAIRTDGNTSAAFGWWNQAIKTPFS